MKRVKKGLPGEAPIGVKKNSSWPAKSGGKKKHDAKGIIESLRHCALSAKSMADTPGTKMYGKSFKKVGRVCDPGDGLPKWRKR